MMRPSSMDGPSPPARDHSTAPCSARDSPQIPRAGAQLVSSERTMIRRVTARDGPRASSSSPSSLGRFPSARARKLASRESNRRAVPPARRERHIDRAALDESKRARATADGAERERPSLGLHADRVRAPEVEPRRARSRRYPSMPIARRVGDRSPLRASSARASPVSVTCPADRAPWRYRRTTLARRRQHARGTG